MYKVKCDDLTIYNPSVEELALSSPTLKLELNKAGSFTFSINSDHKYFNNIDKMKSIITVSQGARILFKGRVRSDTVNFFKVKKVETEGLLTYFNDSIVRPYAFTGGVMDYLKFLIDQHNSQVEEYQRFKLGRVTVTDPNDYITRENSNLPNTWAEIEEKLIKLLGGYICIRYEADGNYIDYLADFSDVSTQDIKYSVNLLDLENAVKSEELATCIIPYGAKITKESDEENDSENDIEERVTIESVNNGVDYVQNNEAVAKYGKIYKVVTWDDVTEPANLLRKAIEALNTSIKLKNTLTIKAIDLHLSDKEIEAFKIGDYILVYSEPHGIEERLLLTSYSLVLNNPSGFTFTLGKESSSFTDNQISTDRETSANVKRIDIMEKKVGDATTTLEKSVQETLKFINQSVDNSEQFTRTLLEEYAKTSNLETLNESISTTFQQLADEINIKFESLTDRITEENGEINRELEKYLKYVRIVDGAIILGESGNDLTTKIANGRISFLYHDNIEVAYISENKLYITNAEILDSIVIGNFGFIPRKIGNLSFKKVR